MLFYILPKDYLLGYYLRYNYHIISQGPVLSGAIVTFMLVLMTREIKKCM